MPEPIVTIFKNIRQTSAGYHRSLSYVLDRIKNGHSMEQVGLIRLSESKEEQSELKSQLPSICFSGTFKTRTDDGIIAHSGLICLDFDNFDNEEVLEVMRDEMQSWQYAHAVFLSPRGMGLKVLVRIPPDKDNHVHFFDAIAKEFSTSKYFDRSSRNISRVCYESHDPKLYFNPESLVWTKMYDRDEVKLGDEKIVIPMLSVSKKIDRLDRWWKRRHGHTKGERNNKMYILAMAMNEYGVPKDDAEHHCAQYAEEYGDDPFTRDEIKRIIQSAYGNSDRHGIKFFNDNEGQEKMSKLIRSGATEQRISEEFKQLPKSAVNVAVERMKEHMSVTDFWGYQKNGKIKLIPHKFKLFLEQHQFYKYFPDKSDSFVLITINGNLVETTSEDRVKDFVLSYLENRDDIGYGPYDFMAENTKFFREDFLSMIGTADIKLKRDTADKCYLYYKNCAVEVTQDGLSTIDYVDLDGFVWKNHIIDREWSDDRGDDGECEFKRFIELIAGEDEKRFNSFMSVAGYLMHSYKSTSGNRAVIFNDEAISENPNGGSGKGLFMTAIGHIKRVSKLDGKTFDFGKAFLYQTVGNDTQVLVFDDVKKNFSFENLFSVITEGITIEKKNKDAYHVPVQDSPKIVISTNYTVGGVGGSFDRRKFEVEMSSHFNASHTPVHEFGHELFTDWDDAEWRRFDRFMVECIQFYLRHGLVEHRFKNLKLRKFIKETSPDFAEWSGMLDGKLNWDNLQPNVHHDKKLKHLDFVEQYKDWKNLSQRAFTRWVEILCQHYGFRYHQGKSNEVRWFEIDTTEDVEKPKGGTDIDELNLDF